FESGGRGFESLRARQHLKLNLHELKNGAGEQKSDRLEPPPAHRRIGYSRDGLRCQPLFCEPTHDGLVLWTRLAPTPLALDGSGGMSKPVSVTWDVATDDAMRNVVRTGIAEADRRFAHSVHVAVDGLEPGRPYWYR